VGATDESLRMGGMAGVNGAVSGHFGSLRDPNSTRKALGSDTPGALMKDATAILAAVLILATIPLAQFAQRHGPSGGPVGTPRRSECK
jgi:uncharacterized membrane protein